MQTITWPLFKEITLVVRISLIPLSTAILAINIPLVFKKTDIIIKSTYTAFSLIGTTIPIPQAIVRPLI